LLLDEDKCSDAETYTITCTAGNSVSVLTDAVRKDGGLPVGVGCMYCMTLELGILGPAVIYP
jgi:hypothetical protein